MIFRCLDIKLIKLRACISIMATEEINKQLHDAVTEGDLHEVERLIGIGAEINIRDEDGWTLLHWAACYGHTNVMDYLIKHISVNTIDEDGETCLYCASVLFTDEDDGQAFRDCVTYLISKGSDPYIKSFTGETILDSKPDAADFIKACYDAWHLNGVIGHSESQKSIAF